MPRREITCGGCYPALQGPAGTLSVLLTVHKTGNRLPWTSWRLHPQGKKEGDTSGPGVQKGKGLYWQRGEKVGKKSLNLLKLTNRRDWRDRNSQWKSCRRVYNVYLRCGCALTSGHLCWADCLIGQACSHSRCVLFETEHGADPTDVKTV